ncbi:branched-chain amino acid ABC transporter permease [Heliobacillus mobilis]|uniref:Branched-chain amino acid ABC transporter permease n=1 Tax=Heliobacterium mobile TaxID=28064 RepID=A0A6I3SHT7_HELMO|nr:AzlC family ABC transporter permease [Heliobacterium mobile]MTV48400.1 branched-chain amino acid ABC transporter permease [Heliobacterium mobile]
MEAGKSSAAIIPTPSTEDFRIALRDTSPILLGIVPFGITCGVMGLTAGLTPLETIMMSIMVFAGASQFVAISMLGAGITSWSVIVFTTLLVNLRHLLMGASLAPYMSQLPKPLQALLAFVLTDESYAITISRTHNGHYSGAYQLGTSVLLYTTWAVSTAVGAYLGSYFPDPLAWGLDFAMPATFMVLLIPRLMEDRIQQIVCAIAAVLAVAGALLLPGKWYIIIACLAASAVGAYLEGGKGGAQ